MLVATIQGSLQQVKKGIQKGGKGADALEFRLDLMEKIDRLTLSKLMKKISLPVIFTLRRKNQGGAFKGNEREREETLLELLTLEPTFVDLEYDAEFSEKVPTGIGVICSYHDFEKTDSDLDAILKKMERMPAKIYKIATMAHSTLDSLRMLLFVKGRSNVAGMCMGPFGEMTRILGVVAGSPLTYGAAQEGEATAPGQLTIQELEHTYHFSTLGPKTKLYGLIGDPVNKSIGHLFHNHAFEEREVDAVYVKMIVKPQEVGPFFSQIKHFPFEGFSVTMPLKEKVGPFLDEIDPETVAIGAINTIVKRDGKWMGSNVDGKGAVDALEDTEKVGGKVAVIVGAGGAAKGIAYELKARGAKVVIANRSPQKGKILAQRVKGMAIAIEEIAALDYDFLINATSVGMVPDLHKMAVPIEALHPETVVFDIISNPKETYLLNQAQNRGCLIVYGLEMFLKQAERQQEIWFEDYS